MRTLIIACLALVASQVAVAQPQDSWETRLEQAYTKRFNSKSYAVIGDNIYAFDAGLRFAASLSSKGTYLFMRCALSKGLKRLSLNNAADREVLQRVRIITPDDNDYTAIADSYYQGCYSLEAWTGKKGSVL